MEARRTRRVATVKFAAKVGDIVHEIFVTRRDALYLVTLDGVEHEVDARKLEADFYSILVEGKSYEVSVESTGAKYVVRHGAHEQVVELADASFGGRDELGKRGGVHAIDSVMPGKVVRVLVAAGDAVEAGQGLVDGIVDDLVDHVMQARAVVGIADIHARPLAHGIEAFQHLDRLGTIV
jgi:biotin carboxyl carrier protein